MSQADAGILQRNTIEPALYRATGPGRPSPRPTGWRLRPPRRAPRRARASAGSASWSHWRSSPWCSWRCGGGRVGAGASGVKPSSPRPSGWTPPTRTRWPRCRSTHWTTSPRRSWSTSTTPCAPVTANWLWQSRNSALRRRIRSAARSPAPRRRWRRRSTSARSSTTPYPSPWTQRRDLLTRVVVAAAKADRELDAQTEAFDKLRDLVINAPARLDVLTQQMVDLTARLGPSEQSLGDATQPIRRCRTDFGGRECGDRQTSAGFGGSEHHHRAGAGRSPGRPADGFGGCRPRRGILTRAGPFATRCGRHRRRRHQPRGRCAARRNHRHQERHQPGQWPTTAGQDRHQNELTAARDQAAAAVADAEKNGSTDPLGAFTRLTKADADLDHLLASVAEERQAIERLSRAFDQALFSAQSRVRGVSDFIDTRRGSIGPEARTRLAEAVRQLQAAQDKRATNLSEAIAHANGADMLAGQAQSLASDDVRAAQRTYTSGWGGGGSGSDMGGVIGGIIIGNILSGAMRGGFGGGFGGASAAGSAWAGRRPSAGRRVRRDAATAVAAAASRPLFARACVSEGDTPRNSPSFRTLTRRAADAAQPRCDATCPRAVA